MWKSLREIFVRGFQQQKHLAQNLKRTTPTTIRTMSADDTEQTTKAPVVQGVPPKLRLNPALKKIDTIEFHAIFSEELKELVDMFERNKFELRIAGGAVRDLVMGLAPKDIDLATTATPNDMKAMFMRENVRMINSKGERHGTITPRINDKENFEVTTLRIDVTTDGRHAEVEFTKDWQLDANRRDLTINSMFLGTDGMLYDYFYGYEDLEERRVRFVGSPKVRICEDYLRILRYFRFYGRIARNANEHEEETLAAIWENRKGLARISGERIWSELQKIVVGNFGCELVEQMVRCELMQFCGLPAEPNLFEFKRLCTDLAVFDGPHSPILYLIALLNVPKDALDLHERLKLSAFERDLAMFITQHRKKVDKDFKVLLDYQKLCLQPYAKREFVEELLKYSNKLTLYNELCAWKIPTFPLNGNHLRDRGCPPGKKMGQILSDLKLIWCDSDFSLSTDALLNDHFPIVMDKAIAAALVSQSKSSKKKRKNSDECKNTIWKIP